jgi:hypothetical protein
MSRGLRALRRTALKPFVSWRPLCGAFVVAAVCGGSVVTAAENDPRYAAYLSLSFGQSELPRQFHYGLRLDQDAWQATYGDSLLPPLVQLDVSRAGFDARLQGLSLTEVGYRVNQAEAGLFGLGTAGTVAAAVGAVAVVAVVADEASDDDDPPPEDGGGETTGGETAGGGGETGGGTPTGGLLGFGYTSLRTPGAAPFLARDRSVDAEHQRWLDGGTGQMGDLD